MMVWGTIGRAHVLTVMFAAASLGGGGTNAPPAPRRLDQELRVSAIPDEGPAELARKFAPLGAYLEGTLGVKVTFIPAPDYAATVENLAARRIDLVWYGGFTFVQARRRTGNAVPLVQREEDTQFHSKIIVPAGSNIQSLDDLRGRAFAFGSISSTSGHLMPRYFLMENGINPEAHFSEVVYSGAHDATVRWVAEGRVAAGAVNESVLQKLIDEKRVDPSKIRVLWTTPAYVDYNWTARRDLDPELLSRLRGALLALDYSNPKHRVILDLQRTRKFVRAESSDYDAIERAAKAAHLIRNSR